MKSIIHLAVLCASVLVLTGCCSTGCDSGWSSMLTSSPYTYMAPGCCGGSCCGSGSW